MLNRELCYLPQACTEIYILLILFGCYIVRSENDVVWVLCIKFFALKCGFTQYGTVYVQLKLLLHLKYSTVLYI